MLDQKEEEIKKLKSELIAYKQKVKNTMKLQNVAGVCESKMLGNKAVALLLTAFLKDLKFLMLKIHFSVLTKAK